MEYAGLNKWKPREGVRAQTYKFNNHASIFKGKDTKTKKDEMHIIYKEKRMDRIQGLKGPQWMIIIDKEDKNQLARARLGR